MRKMLKLEFLNGLPVEKEEEGEQEEEEEEEE